MGSKTIRKMEETTMMRVRYPSREISPGVGRKYMTVPIIMATRSHRFCVSQNRMSVIKLMDSPLFNNENWTSTSLQDTCGFIALEKSHNGVFL